MAYVVNDPNTASNAPTTNAPAGAPVSIASGTGSPGQSSGTGASATSGSAAQGPAAQGPAAPTTSTGTSGQFTNINAYINANQDQSTALGGQAANTINQADINGGQAITQAGTDFTNAVNAATPTYNADTISSAIANPTDAGAVAAAQGLANTSYTGPTQFSGSAQDSSANSALQVANQQAQLGTTSGGRAQILQQLQQNDSNSTPYTSGGLNLNQALIQNNTDAMTGINNAVQNEAGLNTAYTNTGAAAQTAVTPAEQAAQATANQAKTALNQAITPMQQQIDTEVNTAKSNLTNLQNGIKTGLQGSTTGNATLSADQMSSLGVNQGQLDSLNSLNAQIKQLGGTPLDLSQFMVAADPNQITAGNTATTAEQQRYAALQKLAGSNDTYLQNTGAAPTGPTFNVANATASLNGQIQGLQSAAAAAAQANAQTAATAANAPGANYVDTKVMPAVNSTVDKVTSGVNNAYNKVKSGVGTVICSEVYRQGDLTPEQRMTSWNFGVKTMSRASQRGYHFWAVPFVKLMRKNKLAYRLGRQIAYAVFTEADHALNQNPKRSMLGIFLCIVVVPIQSMIGKFVSWDNYKSLYKEQE